MCSNERDVDQVACEKINACDSSNVGSSAVRIERSNDNENDSSMLYCSVSSSVSNSKDNLSSQFSNPIRHDRSRFSNPPMKSSSER